MTQSDPLQSRQEFRDRIQALVAEATTNDIDIEGGYEFQIEHSSYDWDMEIFRVVKRNHESAD